MFVHSLYIELHIPGARSLKEKRSVISSLKTRVKNKFNVSISEVDYLDKWQRAGIGICIVSNDSAFNDSVFTKIETEICKEPRAIITRWEIEAV